MKKFLIAALCAIIAPLASQAQTTTTIEKYQDKPIHGLIVSGAFDVQLRQAKGENKNGAKIEIENELADKLVFDLTDEGYVRISFKDDMSKYFTRSKKKPQAWITVTDLVYLNATGACNVVSTSVFTAPDNIRVLISGNASVNMVEVTAQNAQVEVSGTSDLSDAKFILSNKMLLNQNGTSKFTGNIKAADTHLYISGVSTVTLEGSTSTAVVDVNGTSSLNMVGLTVGKIQAKVGGISKVKANITESGTAEVGATSSFQYTGAGSVTGKGVKRLD